MFLLFPAHPPARARSRRVISCPPCSLQLFPSWRHCCVSLTRPEETGPYDGAGPVPGVQTSPLPPPQLTATQRFCVSSVSSLLPHTSAWGIFSLFALARKAGSEQPLGKWPLGSRKEKELNLPTLREQRWGCSGESMVRSVSQASAVSL